MKEKLFQIKNEFFFFLAKEKRKVSRIFLKRSLSYEDSFKVPIIINNRNRFTYLKGLVDWLNKAGYTNIIVLDNDSNYPPLLEYYTQIPARVIYLKKNVGYQALWSNDLFSKIKKGYYVYTDPDVIPNSNCPNNVVYRLYEVLSKYSEIEKVGATLRINDLPDHYDKKAEVIQWEKRFWERKVEKDVYDALVDTTFALYRPLAFGNAEMCKAYRVGGEFEFLHLPWYIDSLNLTEEEKYYRANVSKTSSYWSSK